MNCCNQIKTVTNCSGFEHKLPLRSNLRYPLAANLQYTWTKKGTVKADAGADDKAKVANPPKTTDEVIGQEAAHGIGHITRSDLNDNNSKDYNVREGEPDAVEIQAVKQTPEFRIEPIPMPTVGIKVDPIK